MAVRTKASLQVENKNNNSGWDELSRLLLSEYLKELDEKDQDNEDLQIHKIRRTKFSTPEGI